MTRRLGNVLLVLGLLFGSIAHAADDPEKQVSRMNKKAMEDYDSLEFESARRTLLDAVAMLRQSGLDETPLAAKTYVHLGIVYIAGFKDRNRGQLQFVDALKIRPDLKLDPAVATPELEEAFAAAQKQAKVKAEPTAPPPEEGQEGSSGLMHTPVDEGKAGEELSVRALLAPHVKAKSVVLLFRGAGQDTFTVVEMKHTSGSEWAGVIPGEAVRGKAIQYYLDARDASGKSLASSGRADDPHIVRLEGNPLIATPAGEKKKPESTNKRGYDRMFLYLMPGFGIGYAPSSSHTEVAWQLGDKGTYRPLPVGTGGAVWAPFHISVEVGWMFTKNFALSALGRFQVVTGANAQDDASVPADQRSTKAFGAAAGLVRARWRFLDGKFHPYIHVDLGGGEIRQMLDVTGAQTTDRPLVDRYSGETYNNDMTSKIMNNVCPASGTCTDSIAIGYFLLGGGAGIWWDVAKHFGLVLDTNLLGAFGGNQTGMNFDVQLGVGTHFL